MMRRAGTALRPHSRPWPRRIAFSTSTRVALASVHRQTSFVAPAHKQQPSPPSGRPTPASSGPGHGATLDDARRVLRETFGFQDFRPEQEPVVSSILDGGDAVLGWPFKSGKTVSWLAALLAEGAIGPASTSAGLAVVILVSSENRNVALTESMASLGIPSASLSTHTSTDARFKVLDALKRLEIQVLCIHPERLRSEGVMQILKDCGARKPIRALICEDAEQASRLSRKFSRLSRRALEFMAELLPEAKRSIVFTLEHQPPAIVEDILELAGFSRETTSISIMPWKTRRNIILWACSMQRDHDKFPNLLEALESTPGRTVVVVPSDYTANRVATKLRWAGVDASALLVDKREFYMSGQSGASQALEHRVVVCVKHNIGCIDAPDVEHVISYAVPPNLFQLDRFIRLARMDHGPGQFTVFLSAEEIFAMRQRFLAMEPSRQGVRHLVSHIFGQVEGKSRAGSILPLYAGKLAHDCDIPFPILQNVVLRLLENQGYLRDMNTAPVATALVFQNPGPIYFPGDEVLTRACAQCTSITEDGLLVLHLDDVARATGRPLSEVASDINNRAGRYKQDMRPLHHSVATMYQLLRPPEAEEMAHLEQEIHAELVKYSQTSADHRQQVIDSLSGHGCITSSIAEKFGAQLSGRGCGRCLHCLGQRTVIPHWPYHEVEQDKVMRVARLLPANASPRAMARFAICADTPFTKATGLQEHPEFGCMKGCRFQDLLRVFAAWRGIPREEHGDL